jgi:TIR domain
MGRIGLARECSAAFGLEITSMALGQIKDKPSVFLSFAGEDVEWKRTLMQPKWWVSLASVASIHDYDDNPARSGGLDASMDEAIFSSSAFVAIISKYYIHKDGVVEREFRSAVERYKAPALHDRFRVVLIDAEAKEWWDTRQSDLFQRHEWLRQITYWELIERGMPALLNGDLEQRYAREARDYAEALANAITVRPAVTPDKPPPVQSGKIITLGQPGRGAAPDAVTENARGPAMLDGRKHVFISHAARDDAIGRRILDAFESQGIKCWYSSRRSDLPTGAEWDDSIVAALDESAAVVLLFSSAANESRWVKREIAIAAERHLPIYPIRIEDVRPTGGMKAYLISIQWTDAHEGNLEESLAAVIATLKP